MSRRTHVAFGLLFTSPLFKTELMPFIPIVLLASVLPDLDLLLKDLPFVEHRKTFHNIWFLMTVYALAARFLPEVSSLVAVSVFSHFIADSLTKQGVMWLYPISKSKLRGPFRTGGTLDNLLFLGSMLTLVYILARRILPL